MNFPEILLLCGGLALFLYGMNIMGIGLEKISGGKLHQTLEKLTSNIFKSIALGAIVAALTHSASATTVVVIGLVNAGILKLRQSIGVIMGASIGTTVTAQILRLGSSGSSNFFIDLLTPRSLAPICAVIGMLIFTFAKKQTNKNIAESLLGFSILFFGMIFMEDSMVRLKDDPETLGKFFMILANPFLGILVGIVITAILHSSAASVGILQALSASGYITYATALPIIMGQNIGTCVTPIMAGFDTKTDAKRASFIHLYFSLIGTLLFCVFIYTFQYFVGFPFWLKAIDKGGIANFHTLFNFITTLVLIPFTGFLEKLTVWTIKGNKSDELTESQDYLLSLDDRLLLSPGLALIKCNDVVLTMANYARKNFNQCVSLINNYDYNVVKKIKDRELAIDRMDDKLSNYLLKLSAEALSEKDSLKISDILHHMGEFERISDHATNISKAIENMYQSKNRLSDAAVKEVSILASAVSEILDDAIKVFKTNNIELAYNVEPLEQVVDAMRSTIKRRHIDRLKEGICIVECGIVFLDILSNLERISDHCSNIALYVIGRASDTEFNTHTYTKELHEGKWEDYNNKYISYTQKYYAEL